MLCYIILSYVVLHYMMLYSIILYYAIFYHIISYYIISCQHILFNIMIATLGSWKELGGRVGSWRAGRAGGPADGQAAHM